MYRLFYPKLSARLETSSPGFFIAGDSAGIFRGLLPALISGFYAGRQAARKNAIDSEGIKATVKIKKSSVRTMPIVFTAQSKNVFYCRDVICEYVLRKNKLPLNPFRIFEYFLHDRVDRNIIRRGNNQLIRTCDELWVFGPISDGVLFELVYAAHIRKPVRFFTIGTRVSDIKPIKNVTDIKFEPEVHASRQRRKSLLNEIQTVFDASVCDKGLQFDLG